MGIFDHSSAWNKHQNHGIGVTLLDNWVEERAVGVQEPPTKTLNKNGHANLLVHPDSHEVNISQAMDAYRVPQVASVPLGKRHALMRERNIARASVKQEEEVECNEYGTCSSVYGKFPGTLAAKRLGASGATAAERAEFDRPITFWSGGKKATHQVDTRFSTPIRLAKE